MIKRNVIISSLISKNILISFFSFLTIFSLIIVGNQFFLVLKQSLNTNFLGYEIFNIVLFKYLRDVNFIIILSFSLSVIYSLNRMYKTSEIVCLRNGGLSDIEIFKIISHVVSTLFLALLLSALFINPEINKNITLITDKAKTRPDFIFLREAVFQNFENKDLTFYASEVTEISENNQRFKDVFLYDNHRNRLILSEKGIKKINPNSGSVDLKLIDGKIYNNVNLPESDKTSISFFKEFTINIYSDKENSDPQVNSFEAKSSLNLFENRNNRESIIELIFRFSVPISLVIMTILSIYLSKTNPRNKKNFSLGFGLILYLIYYNELLYFRDIEINSEIDLYYAFIIPHTTFLILLFMIHYLRKKTLF